MAQEALQVLFLCTGNSARSQIAEGILRAQGGEHFKVFSAGTRPQGVNPLAVKVMAEHGIDISAQKSQHIDEFLEQPLDVVISVCDNAQSDCPIFPRPVKRLHWSHPDPAAVTGEEAERLQAFRDVYVLIENNIKAWLVETGIK